MNRLQTAFFNEVADTTQLLQALEHLPGALFMVKNLDSRYIYMSRALREAINLPARAGSPSAKPTLTSFQKSSLESFRQNDLLVFKHGKPLVNEVHATGFFAACAQVEHSPANIRSTTALEKSLDSSPSTVPTPKSWATTPNSTGCCPPSNMSSATTPTPSLSPPWRSFAACPKASSCASSGRA